MTALEIKKSTKLWSSYFKFSVVRNPWDRALSIYLNESQNQNLSVDFDKWIDEKFSQPCRAYWNQSDWLTDDIDFIARYENLEEDFRSICERLNINLTLPYYPNNRTSHSHYSLYYSTENMNKLFDWFRKDIDKFGYQFSERKFFL